MQSGFEHSIIEFISQRSTVFATAVLYKLLNVHVYFLLHFKENYQRENGKLSIATTLEFISKPKPEI